MYRHHRHRERYGRARRRPERAPATPDRSARTPRASRRPLRPLASSRGGPGMPAACPDPRSGGRARPRPACAPPATPVPERRTRSRLHLRRLRKESSDRPGRRSSPRGFLPVDAAPHPGHLRSRYRFACPQVIHGGGQVPAGHRGVLAGATRVELATVDELHPRVEEEEVGGAGGAVGPGYLLGFVEEHREFDAQLPDHLIERLGPILRVALGVVRADGDYADTPVAVLIADLGEPGLDMLHERRSEEHTSEL